MGKRQTANGEDAGVVVRVGIDGLFTQIEKDQYVADLLINLTPVILKAVRGH